MKKIIFSILVASVTLISYAQNTKNVVYDANAEIRKVDNFTAVEISSAITLYLSQGNENAVAISIQGIDKEKVKTEVKSGTLKIYVENSFWGSRWNDVRIKAYVTVKNIDKIQATGASQVKITDKLVVGNLKVIANGASSVKGDIKADDLKFDLSGASSINTSLSTTKLRIEVSGASTASVNGNATELDIHASGASNIKAYDLVAGSCSAEASGASSIKVNVTKEFTKVEASGASSIHYKGDAAVKNFESSGASSIKKDSGK